MQIIPPLIYLAGLIVGAPLDTAPNRLVLLRKAFAATLRDKALLAEVEKLQIAIDPMSADEVAAIVAETINASPDVVAKAKAAMEGPDTRPQGGGGAAALRARIFGQATSAFSLTSSTCLLLEQRQLHPDGFRWTCSSPQRVSACLAWSGYTCRGLRHASPRTRPIS